MSKTVFLLKSCFASLCLLIAPHGAFASSSYPEYVLSCASLLEKLRNAPVEVPPFQGRPATREEISGSKDLERWHKRNGGELFRIDDDSNGDGPIYRWIPESGEARIIKAYFDRDEGRLSDRQFKFLDHNFPVGILEILPRTGKYRTLRFYQDVHGVTLKHLLQQEYYSKEMNEEIRRLYADHLNAIKARIVERYGINNVRQIKTEWFMSSPDLHLDIMTSPGRKMEIWIHDDNIIFDSQKREFWIIDVE